MVALFHTCTFLASTASKKRTSTVAHSTQKVKSVGVLSMAGDKPNKQEVEVNGNTSGWEPDIQSQITLALLQNGGIERVKSTLKQRLDEAGWSQDLKDYSTRMFRSGEVVTYDDALAKIMSNVNSTGAVTNGSADGAPVPDLRIPIDAQRGGAEALRKELAKVVKQTK